MKGKILLINLCVVLLVTIACANASYESLLLETAEIMNVYAEDLENVVILSGGTDGTDGPTDATGAIIDNDSIKRAEQLDLDPEHHFINNNAYPFFEKISDDLRIKFWVGDAISIIIDGKRFHRYFLYSNKKPLIIIKSEDGLYRFQEPLFERLDGITIDLKYLSITFKNDGAIRFADGVFENEEEAELKALGKSMGAQEGEVSALIAQHKAELAKVTPTLARKLLGVSESATLFEVETAYNRLIDELQADDYDHLGQRLSGCVDKQLKVVQKAYEELKFAGLAVMQHGQGVFITMNESATPVDVRREAITKQAQRLISEAIRIGAEPEEIRDIIETELRKLEN